MEQDMTEQHEIESKVTGMEPHNIRLARQVLAKPYDQRAEASVERILAGEVIRLFEKK